MVRWLIVWLVLGGSSALPAIAQTGSNGDSSSGPSAGSPASPDSRANPAASTPKKIWTNENMGEANGPVSVAGDKRNQKYPMTPGKPTDAGSAAKIRGDLHKLQGQVDEIDRKIASYREFQNGEAVSTAGYEINKGVSRIPVDQQILQLQAKKRDLISKMDALYEEARKKGIEPGQLR